MVVLPLKTSDKEQLAVIHFCRLMLFISTAVAVMQLLCGWLAGCSCIIVPVECK